MATADEAAPVPAVLAVAWVVILAVEVVRHVRAARRHARPSDRASAAGEG